MVQAKDNLFYSIFLFTLLNTLSFTLILVPKIDGILDLTSPHISDNSAMGLLLTFIITAISISVIQKYIKPELSRISYLSIMLACCIGLFGGIYADIIFLYKLAIYNNNYNLLASNLNLYFEQNWLYYSLIIMTMLVMSILSGLVFKVNFKPVSDKVIKIFFILITLIVPIITLIPAPFINLQLFLHFNNGQYYPLPAHILLGQNAIYIALTLLFLIIAYRIRKLTKEHLNFLLRFINQVIAVCAFALVFELSTIVYPYKVLAKMGVIEAKKMFYYASFDIRSYWLGILVLFVFTLGLTLFRKYVKKLQFDDLHNRDNAGNDFGSAKWAAAEDIKEYGFYNHQQEYLYNGKDQKGNNLYFPLTNRTVIAPPGGGKTSVVAIPLALVYDGPLVITDFKGEIWAVTAYYRYIKFKRTQIAIDPFNIIQQPEFQYHADLTEKPADLLFKFKLNPFCEIPDDPYLRQRVITAFASSFIVREDSGASATHFYDNAEILICGLIDYIIKTLPSKEQNLISLLSLSQVSLEELPTLLENMLEAGGEAANAASMVAKLGTDERGSLFSTTGRQLAWLIDVNMQDFLSDSNFSIEELIQGNADIYIILPPDVARTHGRVIRMIIALLRGALIRCKPSKLPGREIVLLLDEIAQLGKCPDIEQAIEIFRSYGIIVYTIFQFMSQIEKFDKPDVFTNAATLQFFTTKDNDTMKFIQDKINKTTILQKTLSSNKGDQKQKNQIWGGSASTGESESVNSVGVDLVHFDQIREMADEEQWILVANKRPIKAQRIPYFKDEYFAGKYDPNPIENKAFIKMIEEHIKSKAENKGLEDKENIM